MSYLAILLIGFSIGYIIRGEREIKRNKELLEWIKGERYILEDNITEKYENEHLYELGSNRMIEKVIRKINK